jgi:universal stress protein A
MIVNQEIWKPADKKIKTRVKYSHATCSKQIRIVRLYEILMPKTVTRNDHRFEKIQAFTLFQTRNEIMFKPYRILVPTDLSEHSDKALRQAFDIAQQYDPEVIVLHVMKDPVRYCTIDYLINDDLLNQMDSEMRRDAKREVNNQLAKFSSMGHFAVTTDIRAGTECDEILKEADEKQVDLIVMSSSCSNLFSKNVLGMVARNVASKAKCPVLLTH